MCGICGVVSFDTGHIFEPDLIQAMTLSLAHRGPDDDGIYLGPGIGLGSRRLSILDLS